MSPKRRSLRDFHGLAVNSLVTCLLCVAAFFSGHPHASADGGVSDGGGTGLACFETREEALSALDENGALKRGYRARIRSLDTTDAVEYETVYGGFSTPLPGDSALTYLSRIIETRVKPFSPGFAEKLKKAITLADPKAWNSGPGRDGEKVVLLNDLGDSFPLRQALRERPDCAVVPLINRRDINTGELWPRVKVTHDPALLAIMRTAGKSRFGSTLNEGILILHEALYILATKMGHRTSERTRDLAAILLSANPTHFIRSEIDFLRLLKYAGLDRLDLFFQTADSQLPPNKHERYRAFDRLMNDSIAAEAELAKAVCKSTGANDCDKSEYIWSYSRPFVAEVTETLWSKPALDHYSEAEAFMLMAWSIAERSTIESLMSPGGAECPLFLEICQLQEGNLNRNSLQSFTDSLAVFLRLQKNHEFWQKVARYCKTHLPRSCGHTPVQKPCS
ncbi:MAG: hypothetical protein NDJ90_10680 [Oligoflexia bacterium]|nr:hypothetical protein [Oligoflexia bacterium]